MQLLDRAVLTVALASAALATDACSFDGKLGVCTVSCPSSLPQKPGICPKASDICCIEGPAPPPAPTPPPSTPTPPPAPPPTPDIGKKGVAASPGNYDCADFAALNVSSFINWNQGSNCDVGSAADAMHVPQIWGAAQVGNVPSGDGWVMAFNEPNFDFSGGGSHIAPADAAGMWPQLKQALGSRPLVSPATSTCDVAHQTGCLWNGFDWMDQFLGNCTVQHGSAGCSFDAVAFHSYSCNAAAVNDLATQYSERYGGRKVWLSEFSCANGTAAQNLVLANELLPLLEANPVVQRYYWCATTRQQAEQFPFLEGSELIAQAGAPPVQLTPVGEYFRTV
jgi:hypothetical protein